MEHETDESPTRIDIEDLTDEELDALLDREEVTIGYASERTDADHMTVTIRPPEGRDRLKCRTAWIEGVDANDPDRPITVRLKPGIGGRVKSHGGTTLGSLLFLEADGYDRPAIERPTVTFTVQRGQWSTSMDAETAEDAIEEDIRDRHGYDHLDYTLESFEGIELVPRGESEVLQGRFTVAVDVTVPAGTDEETVIERAKRAIPEHWYTRYSDHRHENFDLVWIVDTSVE